MFAAEHVGLRKAFWASGAWKSYAYRSRCGVWYWDWAPRWAAPGPVDWPTWRGFSRSRHRWSEHRKIGKINRRRLRRERLAREVPPCPIP